MNRRSRRLASKHCGLNSGLKFLGSKCGRSSEGFSGLPTAFSGSLQLGGGSKVSFDGHGRLCITSGSTELVLTGPEADLAALGKAAEAFGKAASAPAAGILSPRELVERSASERALVEALEAARAESAKAEAAAARAAAADARRWAACNGLRGIGTTPS